MDIGSLIEAIAGAGSALGQGAVGIWELLQAKKLEKQYPRPTAEVDPAILDALRYAYARTLDQDIPGGDIYRNQVMGTVSEGLKAATRSNRGAEAFGSLAQMVQGGIKGGETEILKLIQQNQKGAGKNYLDILTGPVYQENRRVNYWEKEMPYLQAAQLAQQYSSQGWPNIIGGFLGGGQYSAGKFETAFSGNSGSYGGYSGSGNNEMSEADLEELIKSVTQKTAQNG
jgi:hypothetical protein